MPASLSEAVLRIVRRLRWELQTQLNMKSKKYQLQYGYLHCVGRKTYVVGTVDTKEEALEWVAGQTSSDLFKTRDADNDPIHWCPVHHCHMKRQKPWFTYVEIETEES